MQTIKINNQYTVICFKLIDGVESTFPVHLLKAIINTILNAHKERIEPIHVTYGICTYNVSLVQGNTINVVETTNDVLFIIEDICELCYR